MIYINSQIRFGFFAVGVTLLALMPNFFTAHAQNVGKGKKIKPLIVLADQNRPNLNYNGSRVVAGPEIGLEEVFDVDTGKLLGSYKIEKSDTALLSPDGKKVRIFYDFYQKNNSFESDRYQVTYEVETGKILSQERTAVYENGEHYVTFSVRPNGPDTARNYTADLSMVAVSYPTIYTKKNKPDQPAVLIGNIDSNNVVSELFIDDEFVERDNWSETAMTPDGKFVVSTRNNFKHKERNKTVVWDAEKRKVIFSLPFYSYWLSISADGQRLITGKGEGDGRIEIWDVATGKKISTLTQSAKGKKVTTGHGLMSPDGKILATTTEKEILFWETETGQCVGSQDQSKYSGGNVKSIAFSGDGKRTAIGSDTEVVTVWSVDEILKNAKSN